MSIRQACSARVCPYIVLLPVWSEYQKSDKAIEAVNGTAAPQKMAPEGTAERIRWVAGAPLTASLRYRMASPCAVRSRTRSPHMEIRRQCARHNRRCHITILRRGDGDQASYPLVHTLPLTSPRQCRRKRGSQWHVARQARPPASWSRRRRTTQANRESLCCVLPLRAPA